MNQALLEQRLAELPLYSYFFTSPSQLEFSPRVRWICEHECGQYGQSWACPPGVGTVEECQAHCMRYQTCLVIATITEVTDIANLEETLSTRRGHEEITDQAAEILRQLGAAPFVLSTESCAICPRCAILDGLPCRHPERMFPCVESQGILVTDLAEKHGLDFMNGNIVVWFSLILFK